MTTLRLDDLRQHSDLLRSRSGEPVTVRFVEPEDGEALQAYFRALSVRSRYNRFLGAMSELSQTQLDQFTHAGELDRFSVVATMMIHGFETIAAHCREALVSNHPDEEYSLVGWSFGGALALEVACQMAARGQRVRNVVLIDGGLALT